MDAKDIHPERYAEIAGFKLTNHIAKVNVTAFTEVIPRSGATKRQDCSSSRVVMANQKTVVTQYAGMLPLLH